MAKVIIAAGMHRSGSTWLFNVLRYCGTSAGLRTFSEYAETTNKKIDADFYVIKTHLYFKDLHEHSSLIFTTCRDLRDIAASMVRRNLVENDPKALADWVDGALRDEYRAWKPYSDMEIQYETMIADKPLAIKAILDKLELPHVDPYEVHHDVEKLKYFVADGVNKETQLWPDHFTDGRAHTYQNTLSAASVRAIEHVGREWLIEHGYDVPPKTYYTFRRAAGTVKRIVLTKMPHLHLAHPLANISSSGIHTS